MKLRDKLKEFQRYLNGNPAMAEIWADAIDRIENDEPLAPVQQIVMREWYTRASARKHQLELEAQRDMLSDDKYAELAALTEQLELLKKFH